MSTSVPTDTVHDLDEMLARLAPQLDPVEYIFARLEDAHAPPPADMIFASVRESEGTTLILTADAVAVAGVTPVARFARIELGVHSDLEAVGLLAAVTAKLTAARIPVNVVSAIHHDHLFVPPALAPTAVAALQETSARVARQ